MSNAAGSSRSRHGGSGASGSGSSRSRHGESGPSGSGRQRTASPEPPRTDILKNFRVLDQSYEDPAHTPAIKSSSPAFRVVAFATHLGLSMLESTRGRRQLERIGIDSWKAYGSRGRRQLIIQGDVDRHPSLMTDFVTTFLHKCRADPPNILISDRISGEGLAKRVDWADFLGRQPKDYSAKWAAIFRLNKVIVDNAVNAAVMDEAGSLRNFLFLLGLTVAHELVHMFMGFMTGDAGRDTPAIVDHPPGSSLSARPGESGRAWEAGFLGYSIETYENPQDPLQEWQAGTFYAKVNQSSGYGIDPDWIEACLRCDFPYPIGRIGRQPDGKPFKLRSNMRSMEQVRGQPIAQDIIGDLTYYFESVNAMPLTRIGSSELEDIMKMARSTRHVRAPSPAYG